MSEEIAGRLNEARGERSIRSLQRALKDRDVPGSSYPNVHAYFSGETKPSIEFLAAVADELGVNPAWLAFGQEPVRAAPNPVTRAMMQAESGADALAAMTLGASEPLMQALLRRLVDARPTDGPEPVAADLEALVNSVQYSVLRLYSALGSRQSHSLLSRPLPFVVSVLSAMLALVPEPGEGRPLTEVAALLAPNREDSDAS